MPRYGFFAEFEARPGKEEECAAFLAEVKALIDEEPGTRAWFAFRIGPSRFHTFDVFETEADRQAHAEGAAREMIEARALDLFTALPVVIPVDVVAAKLP